MKKLITILLCFLCGINTAVQGQTKIVGHYTILTLLALCLTIVLPAQERITLLFVGDLMQHQVQIDAARTPDGCYDYQSCFALVKEQIAGADLAIGNLEVTLGGKPYSGYPAFSAPDEYLQAIKDTGFDILMTANNHCLDRGQERTGTHYHDVGFPSNTTCGNIQE